MTRKTSTAAAENLIFEAKLMAVRSRPEASVIQFPVVPGKTLKERQANLEKALKAFLRDNDAGGSHDP